MLSQAVEPLREVSRKSIFEMKGVLTIQLNRIIGSRDGVSLAQEGFSRPRAVLDVPPLQRKLDLQSVGCEDDRIGCLCYLELCTGTRFVRVEHPWLVLPDRTGRIGIGNKMDDSRTANRNVNLLSTDGKGHTIRRRYILHRSQWRRIPKLGPRIRCTP